LLLFNWTFLFRKASKIDETARTRDNDGSIPRTLDGNRAFPEFTWLLGPKNSRSIVVGYVPYEHNILYYRIKKKEPAQPSSSSRFILGGSNHGEKNNRIFTVKERIFRSAVLSMVEPLDAAMRVRYFFSSIKRTRIDLSFGREYRRV